jgi:hypothetical protein
VYHDDVENKLVIPGKLLEVVGSLYGTGSSLEQTTDLLWSYAAPQPPTFIGCICSLGMKGASP